MNQPRPAHPGGSFSLMSSDIDIAVSAAKRLEHLLRKRYGAKGRGLHSLISNVERNLPSNTVKGLRWVATHRNKLVHEEGHKLPPKKQFLKEVARLEKALRVGRRRRGRLPPQVVGLAVCLLTLAVLACLIKFR